jgi:hypothetical protein
VTNITTIQVKFNTQANFEVKIIIKRVKIGILTDLMKNNIYIPFFGI